MPSLLNCNIIDGDMLDADQDFILHQCNCVTTRAAGLAADIFDHFPWADIYSERLGRDVPVPDQRPGVAVLRGDGIDDRYVIALMGSIAVSENPGISG